MYKAILVLAVFIATGNASNCVPRDFGADSIVCVCNATYCDETPDNDPVIPKEGSFYQYVSSKDGQRLNLTRGQFGSCQSTSDATLVVDSSKTFQTIFGFGGAFTDSTGLNIKKLSPETQDRLIRSYYCPKTGSRYNFGRVPIGGCDFSTRAYTYDDFSGDVQLEHFALAPEDYDYKIPFMKRALELNPETKFLGAAWTAPPWMKTNNDYNGFGFLKREHYQTYVDYHLRFLDEYKKNGIDFWGISTGNEPMNGLVPFIRINSMAWTPNSVANWVANNLGPSLAKSKHNDTLILALDDQRFELPWYVDRVFRNEKAKSYIAGTAVHWYYDSIISPRRLTETHENYPEKFIMMTEACTGSEVWIRHKVILGSWERGEKYILNIMESLIHWLTGWIDWNLALDENGGPNWIQNFVDSPIIVNPENDEFYKQPMYYAIKHFSRFVDEGSLRISITDTSDIKSVAFVTPLKQTVVVLYNRRNRPKSVTLKDLQKGTICLELPPFSVHTVIYRQ